jgi:hypothetical protein
MKVNDPFIALSREPLTAASNVELVRSSGMNYLIRATVSSEGTDSRISCRSLLPTMYRYLHQHCNCFLLRTNIPHQFRASNTSSYCHFKVQDNLSSSRGKCQTSSICTCQCPHTIGASPTRSPRIPQTGDLLAPPTSYQTHPFVTVPPSPMQPITPPDQIKQPCNFLARITSHIPVERPHIPQQHSFCIPLSHTQLLNICCTALSTQSLLPQKAIFLYLQARQTGHPLSLYNAFPCGSGVCCDDDGHGCLSGTQKRAQL